MPAAMLATSLTVPWVPKMTYRPIAIATTRAPTDGARKTQ